MLRRSFLGMMLIALSSASLAWAQLEQVIDPRVAAVAPYVNDKTMLVLHLNLKNLDLKTAADRMAALAPAEGQEQLKQVKAGAQLIEFARKGMIDAGGSDLYVIADAVGGGLPPMAYMMIPVETGKDPQQVITTLSGMPGVDKEPFVHKGNVIYGDDGTKEFLDTIVPTDADRFTYAYKFAGQTDFQLVVAPTAKVLEEAKANIPGGEVDPAQEELAKGMRGFVLTANLPPKPALALFMLMKDEAAATKVNAMVQDGLNSEQGQQIKAHPLGARAVELLTPVQDGDKLRVVLTEANGGIPKLTEILKEAAALGMEAFKNGELPIPGFGPGGAPGAQPGADPFGAPLDEFK